MDEKLKPPVEMEPELIIIEEGRDANQKWQRCSYRGKEFKVWASGTWSPDESGGLEKFTPQLAFFKIGEGETNEVISSAIREGYTLMGTALLNAQEAIDAELDKPE